MAVPEASVRTERVKTAPEASERSAGGTRSQWKGAGKCHRAVAADDTAGSGRKQGGSIPAEGQHPSASRIAKHAARGLSCHTNHYSTGPSDARSRGKKHVWSKRLRDCGSGYCLGRSGMVHRDPLHARGELGHEPKEPKRIGQIVGKSRNESRVSLCYCLGCIVSRESRAEVQYRNHSTTTGVRAAASKS